MQKAVIDFELVEGRNAMTVFEELQAAQYNMAKGPLWKVRMVHLSPSESSPRGVQAEHQAMIVFGIHHGVTDAKTNAIVCKELVSILNDIHQGRDIACKHYPFIDQPAEKLIESTRVYRIKYLWKKVYRIFITDFRKKKITANNVIPLPKYSSICEKEVHHVFSEDTTEKLLKKCKEHGATVHSLVVMATNIAYLDAVRRLSTKSVEDVHVYYIDTFDTRRYYENNSDALGCHMSLYERNVAISSHTKENFWDCARLEKTQLHEALTSKKALGIIPILNYGTLEYVSNSILNRLKRPNIYDCLYCTTNVGDMGKILGKINPGDPFQISDMFRSVTDEKLGCMFTLTLGTFQNRLYLTYDYPTNKCTDAIANTLLNNAKEIITNLAENKPLD